MPDESLDSVGNQLTSDGDQGPVILTDEPEAINDTEVVDDDVSEPEVTVTSTVTTTILQKPIPKVHSLDGMIDVNFFDRYECSVVQSISKNGGSPFSFERIITLTSGGQGQPWKGIVFGWFDLSKTPIGVNSTIEMPVEIILGEFLSGKIGAMKTFGKVFVNPDDLSESGFDLSGIHEFTVNGDSYNENARISCRTPMDSEVIFTDGFESGDVSAW